jgi:threonine dehydrogenase-like Zn-dependent dehydrogenase
MRTKAAILVAPQRFEMQNIELPPLATTQMLVKIKACGLCHSELGRYLGKGRTWLGDPIVYPIRMGHEAAGVVEEVGNEIKDFQPGDRVTGVWYTPTFAEYAILDVVGAGRVARVVKVPDHVPLEHCVGEPMKCGVSIVRYSQVKFGDYVFVAGCGFMGLLVIANLAARGLSGLIACDVIESRLQLAMNMGATAALNPREVDVAQEVKRITGGKMCDVVYEGIGKPVGVDLVNRALRSGPPPGIVVLYGYHAWPDTYDLSLWGPKAPLIISLHPAYSPDTMRDLEIAMKVLGAGLYPMEKLITHTYRLEGVGEGFEALVTPPDGYVKGIVMP